MFISKKIFSSTSRDLLLYCAYTSAGAPMGRGPMGRLLGMRHIAYHCCSRIDVDSELTGTHVRLQGLRREHEGMQEPFRHVDHVGRGLSQLPSRVPARLCRVRVQQPQGKQDYQVH